MNKVATDNLIDQLTISEPIIQMVNIYNNQYIDNYIHIVNEIINDLLLIIVKMIL